MEENMNEVVETAVEDFAEKSGRNVGDIALGGAIVGGTMLLGTLVYKKGIKPLLKKLKRKSYEEPEFEEEFEDDVETTDVKVVEKTEKKK